MQGCRPTKPPSTKCSITGKQIKNIYVLDGLEDMWAISIESICTNVSVYTLYAIMANRIYFTVLR